MNSIYCVQHRGSGLVKVGISRRLSMRCLQLGIGEKTDLLLAVACNDHEAQEKRLHSELDQHRLPQSEWFHLDHKGVGSLLAELRRLGPEIFYSDGDRKTAERNKKRNQRGTDLSQRNCEVCNAAFTPKRSHAKVCSAKCRAKLSRQKASA